MACGLESGRKFVKLYKIKHDELPAVKREPRKSEPLSLALAEINYLETGKVLMFFCGIDDVRFKCFLSLSNIKSFSVFHCN